MKSAAKLDTDKNLINDIKLLIEETKRLVASSVNSALTILYWKIGNRINEDILKNKRAGYGEEIISSLSKQLTGLFGRGWSKQQLWNCLYTVEIFPDIRIVLPVSSIRYPASSIKHQASSIFLTHNSKLLIINY